MMFKTLQILSYKTGIIGLRCEKVYELSSSWEIKETVKDIWKTELH